MPAEIREYQHGRLKMIRHLVFDGWALVAQQTQAFTLNLDNRVELMAGEVETQYAVSAPTGEPLALFDPTGKRVWRQPKQSLYGLRLSGLGENPQLDPGLRFAGQLFDEESGLFYNRFRYYLPEATCYLSPDPLGLAGGVNPYSYVHNPTGWIDPLGLAGCPSTGARSSSQMSRVERQARINKLAEANAYRRLQEMQNATPRAHFLDKHGAQTSLGDQIARATTGRNPATGAIERIPTAATRFLSHRDQLNAIQRAQTIYRQAGRTMAESTINYGRWIGEGIQSGTLQHSMSHGAKVWFNRTGEVITAFPVWGS
ncbi:RHS repeat-associated core domain-containing protein [Photorhabdus australis]|uniref:RHS repeat-associated core domain-containing protein n=1 Tax=Photorhabdus australis TaxID=286156 RepID=UPI00056D265D|nr:RHS repeat-associated core domain-containing protein [Photorhabdus australis]